MVVVLQSFRSFNCFSTYFIFFKTWTTHWASPYKEPIYDMSSCLRNSVCCVEGYVEWGRRLEAGPAKITLNRYCPITTAPSSQHSLFFVNNYLEKGKHKDDVSCIQLGYSLILSFLKQDVRVVHIFRNLRYRLGAWILETYPIRIWPRTLINWLISHTVYSISVWGKSFNLIKKKYFGFSTP